MENLKQEKHDSEVDAILDKLITDGKSTQEFNKSLKDILNGKSIEQIKTFCDALPVKVKFERQSEDVIESDIPTKEDKEAEHQYRKHKNLWMH
jgi:hypothetical protein